MRAILQTAFGGPEVLEPGEAERPEPLPTEVLVRVAAAGVNPVDVKTRQGKGMAAVLGDPPFVPGWDVAGTVEAVGRGVTRFAPGDRVFGMPWFPRAAGAYAEYVAAPSRHFARTPDELTDEAAAGLPLAGLTAWQALVDTAAITASDRVLVQAAAGGVGHLAVQVAKARGAHVTGTAREDKHPFLRDLGADAAVDYAREGWEGELEPVDVALDGVGTEASGLACLACLREGGRLIVLPSGAADTVAGHGERQGKRVHGILVEPDGHGLECLAGLAATGRLRVEVERAFPLHEAAAAHEHLERGRTRGKLVLTV